MTLGGGGGLFFPDLIHLPGQIQAVKTRFSGLRPANSQGFTGSGAVPGISGIIDELGEFCQSYGRSGTPNYI